jgi:hypothetical protein
VRDQSIERISAPISPPPISHSRRADFGLIVEDRSMADLLVSFQHPTVARKLCMIFPKIGKSLLKHTFPATAW